MSSKRGTAIQPHDIEEDLPQRRPRAKTYSSTATTKEPLFFTDTREPRPPVARSESSQSISKIINPHGITIPEGPGGSSPATTRLLRHQQGLESPGQKPASITTNQEVKEGQKPASITTKQGVKGQKPASITTNQEARIVTNKRDRSSSGCLS